MRLAHDRSADCGRPNSEGTRPKEAATIDDDEQIFGVLHVPMQPDLIRITVSATAAGRRGSGCQIAVGWSGLAARSRQRFNSPRIHGRRMRSWIIWRGARSAPGKTMMTGRPSGSRPSSNVMPSLVSQPT